MMSRKTTSGLILASMALVVTLGCEKEPEPQVTVAPPPQPVTPPPPPAPKLSTVDQLMSSLGIDDRVVMYEDKAPPTEDERVAVLEFFDAFARGDVGSLGPMLSVIDRQELDALAATDAWSPTIDGIEEILVETGVVEAGTPYEQKCALAIFTVNGEDQPQLWYYKSEADPRTGGTFMFDAAAAPPDIMNRLYGDDWIATWHEILDEEAALASKPDEDISPLSVDLDEGEEEEEQTSGGGGAPSLAPGGGSGRNKRRRPTGAPGGKPPGPGSPG